MQFELTFILYGDTLVIHYIVYLKSVKLPAVVMLLFILLYPLFLPSVLFS